MAKDISANIMMAGAALCLEGCVCVGCRIDPVLNELASLRNK